nr:class I SAM-dependent methyltransferase [Cyanobium sp. LEGE 06143]
MDSSTKAVVIADLGCAQGMATALLIRSSVESIRTRSPHIPIHVVHNDVLQNDWAGLYEALRREESYLRVREGPITPMTAACSFYQLVMPPGVLNLGLSFAALQWLERPGPASAGTALFFDQLAGAEALEMAEQAHQDWSRFLALRAIELAPGGCLVLVMMGRHPNGSATGHTLWAAIRAIAEELVLEGRI